MKIEAEYTTTLRKIAKRGTRVASERRKKEEKNDYNDCRTRVFIPHIQNEKYSGKLFNGRKERFFRELFSEMIHNF